ncbi:MAG: hypothetical protein J5706_06205 [Elusimicrobiales bacterium]|nr:hypothetical protein [Elusimicrobiales bacterium]
MFKWSLFLAAITLGILTYFDPAPGKDPWLKIMIDLSIPFVYYFLFWSVSKLFKAKQKQ